MIYFISRNVNETLFETDIQICDVEFAKDYLQKLDLIGVDTETEGFDPYVNKVLTLQLGHKENQFVIDTSTIDMVEFKDLMESKPLILQNAKFDLRFFYHQGIYPNQVYDTFLAEVKLYQGIMNHPKNLQALAERYCKTIEVDKSLRSLIHYKGLVPEVITYAANDVKYLHEIREKQLFKAECEGLDKAISLENRFVPALAYMEYSGMHIDEKLWRQKTQKSFEKLELARKALDNYVIKNNLTNYIDKQLDLFSTESKTTINWSSDHQVKPLFKELGIDVVVFEKGKRKESIEAGVLLKQKDKFPIIPLYLDYQKWAKDSSTYGLSFLNKIHKVTDRIHTQFTQVVDTGRMASGGKNKATGESYINFQNIPATPEEHEEGMVYARQCITPAEGNVFVNADYSGWQTKLKLYIQINVYKMYIVM